MPHRLDRLEDRCGCVPLERRDPYLAAGGIAEKDDFAAFRLLLDRAFVSVAGLAG